MISLADDALHACDQYRNAYGFCTRNDSCSGLSFGGTLAQHQAAKEEAEAEGIERYTLASGKCGDWYIVPLDDKGRFI